MELAALALGFVGSLHCVMMCSPLAIAVTQGSARWEKRLLYNAGRILTYGILGATTAGLGVLFSFVKLQNILSITMGVFLLLAGIIGMTTVKLPLVTPLLNKVVIRLKRTFQQFLSRKTNSSLIFMGAINGILPCGLTFAALTICLSLQGPLDGFLFMILFGAGTLPVMLGFVSTIGELWKGLKLNYNTVLSVSLALSGIVLIVRVFLPHSHSIGSLNEVADIVMCR